MRDLGLNPRQKKTFFEEWFTPYRPQDYRGVIEEYPTTHSRQAGEDKKTEEPSKLRNELSNGHGQVAWENAPSRN
jgi:hypothetical protein